MLTVLSVGFALAPVGADSVGGAEQVLAQLDAALVHAGHRSIVVASAGSSVAGELVPMTSTGAALDDIARGRACTDFRAAISDTLARETVDLVHMHGVDFHEYLPPPEVPVLVTLHLPLDWYPRHVFDGARPRTWLHCVSAAQRALCPPGARLLPDIPNGVPVERLSARHAKRDFVLALGRICPEKGFHLALDAARRSGVRLLLGGRVFGYAAHEAYFRDEILPRLGMHSRFIGAVDFRRKRRLLTAARCLLVPSLAPETSSLVAMEAIACGTPVIAFPAGALPDIVEHGRTGYIVHDVHEMAEAIAAASTIDPEECRAVARTRFSVENMTGRYLELYPRLVNGGVAPDAHAA